MTREEMLHQLDILVKNSEEMDDAVRDYERGGRLSHLEQIETHGVRAVAAARELQEWHS